MVKLSQATVNWILKQDMIRILNQWRHENAEGPLQLYLFLKWAKRLVPRMDNSSHENKKSLKSIL